MFRKCMASVALVMLLAVTASAQDAKTIAANATPRTSPPHPESFAPTTTGKCTAAARMSSCSEGNSAAIAGKC